MPRKTRRLTSSKKQQRTRSKSRAGVGFFAGLGGIAVVANALFEVYRKRRFKVYGKIAIAVTLEEHHGWSPSFLLKEKIVNNCMYNSSSSEDDKFELATKIARDIAAMYNEYDRIGNEAEKESLEARLRRLRFVIEVMFKKYDRFGKIKMAKQFYREMQQDKLEGYLKDNDVDQDEAKAVQKFKTKESKIWQIPPVKLKYGNFPRSRFEKAQQMLVES